MASVNALKVLLVDDEQSITLSLGKILELSGFRVTISHNGTDAMEHAKAEPFDVLLTDVMLPGMNGIQLAKEIKKICSECKVILLSGNISTQQLLDEARASGENFEILPKPIHPTEIIERLSSIDQLRRK